MDYATDEYTVNMPYNTRKMHIPAATRYLCGWCGRGSAPPGGECPTCGTWHPSEKAFLWVRDFRGYADDTDDTPVPTMN